MHITAYPVYILGMPFEIIIDFNKSFGFALSNPDKVSYVNANSVILPYVINEVRLNLKDSTLLEEKAIKLKRLIADKYSKYSNSRWRSNRLKMGLFLEVVS
jgi:hypothetical protein